MTKKLTFSITEDLTELFPQTSIAGLLITNIQLKEVDHDFKSYQKQLVDTVLQQKGSIMQRKEITSWQRLFSTLGLNPRKADASHIALTKRILKDKSLPSINLLVDIYNAISVKELTPVGGHDVGNFTNIRVGKTTGQETFTPMNTEDTETLAADEFAYLTEDIVLTRNLVWRQGNHSKVTDATKELFIPIDDITGVKSNSRLEKIAFELLNLLDIFFEFEWDFGIVTRHNREMVLTATNKPIPSIQTRIVLTEPQIDTSQESIDKFFDRKLDLIYPSTEEFRSALESGQRLKFYIGADATGPRLHIGHSIPVLKMAQLQEMGHKVIFLIGDFTAKIGDPTDKTAARVMLTDEEVAKNAKFFKEQISKYIDFDNETNPAELRFNSDWNEELSFSDVINLSSNFTVQQMLERDMFKVRLEENKPIYLHEFLYPLIQGYDSVFMEVDGEFGGRDQTFNMLAGRTLSKSLRDINKYVITTHFLLSADGKTKMSKSIGNCIFISDTPEDKYGKVMAIPDDLIIHYYELATFASDSEIASIKEQINNGTDPMLLKKQLAYEIVKLNDGEAEAIKAQEFFEKTVQNKEMPSDVRTISKAELRNIFGSDSFSLKNLLSEVDLVESNSEAKRLISSGAVEINGEKITDINAQVQLTDINTIKAGKRNWLKLID